MPTSSTNHPDPWPLRPHLSSQRWRPHARPVPPLLLITFEGKRATLTCPGRRCRDKSFVICLKPRFVGVFDMSRYLPGYAVTRAPISGLEKTLKIITLRVFSLNKLCAQSQRRTTLRHTGQAAYPFYTNIKYAAGFATTGGCAHSGALGLAASAPLLHDV